MRYCWGDGMSELRERVIAYNNVKCEYILEGQFTKETLSKYTTLVITVNYRRNTAKAKDYTDEEIAALKDFMANGGKLIICSKSDRDNKFDNCAVVMPATPP